MMKRNLTALGLAAALAVGLTACGTAGPGADSGSRSDSSSANHSAQARELALSDSGVTLDGAALTDQGDVVAGREIVYYEAGKDSTYGEGTEADAHTPEEARAHTVVTITAPGTYRVSGKLTAGQLAVDLGEDAKTDPDAVVTLLLDGVDITCTVAPAVIFYNVYECDAGWVAYDESGSEEPYEGKTEVDTSAAGANVVLADGSVNSVSGSYVAKIYKEGTEKKLHKYDGAFYSKMSMNISGEAEGTGTLNITAENEGLDTELHLTLNGGHVNIQAQNDGINTNEDGVSVTTVNGGVLQINAGLGEEGDGIDSNGSLVINGGNVYALSSVHSGDGGLDADGDILLNGGFVVGLGMRNDAISPQSAQPYLALSVPSSLPSGAQVELTDPEGNVVLSFTTEKAAQSLVFSSEGLKKDAGYTLKVDGEIREYAEDGGMGPGGGPRPGDGQKPPERPDGMEPPDGQRPPEDGQGRPGNTDSGKE